MTLEELKAHTKRYSVATCKLRFRFTGIPVGIKSLEDVVVDYNNICITAFEKNMYREPTGLEVLLIHKRNESIVKQAIDELREDSSLSQDELIILQDVRTEIDSKQGRVVKKYQN